jgi:hypothetical protein
MQRCRQTASPWQSCRSKWALSQGWALRKPRRASGWTWTRAGGHRWSCARYGGCMLYDVSCMHPALWRLRVSHAGVLVHQCCCGVVQMESIEDTTQALLKKLADGQASSELARPPLLSIRSLLFRDLHGLCTMLPKRQAAAYIVFDRQIRPSTRRTRRRSRSASWRCRRPGRRTAWPRGPSLRWKRRRPLPTSPPRCCSGARRAPKSLHTCASLLHLH